MGSQRNWIVSIDKDILFKCLDQGEEKYILIGYENGLNARKSELYFYQRENDQSSYVVEFDPEPYFISYSFFNGFFGQTIKNICLKDDLLMRNTSISHRKVALKFFLDKYQLSFTKNKDLENIIKGYAEALIENVLDIQAKMSEI